MHLLRCGAGIGSLLVSECTCLLTSRSWQRYYLLKERRGRVVLDQLVQEGHGPKRVYRLTGFVEAAVPSSDQR
jgi:hypothetical protein